MDDHQALLTFKAFNILFDNENAVFAPGDELTGKIFLHPINDVQISPIRLSFKGYGTLCNPDDETLLETVKYWDKTIDLGINVETFKGGQDHFIPFHETLPLNLETSIESRSLTITYSVKARFTYRSPENNVAPLAAIRGFTIISPTNLEYLDIHHFKANTYSISKKFGFLCMAGHVNLKINVERTAYLNAENIVLEGQIENHSSRRIDNVIGVLQKIVEVNGYTSNSKLNSCEKPSLTKISTEVSTVKKENLAMYIDPHKTLKISRNFSVPTCRPSSFDYIHIGHYSVSVSYWMRIKVKQVNELCGINIPIFIGSVPHQSCHSKKNRWMKVDVETQQNDDEKRVLYQRDLSERPCSLFESNETYLSKLNRMLHINVYPYFPYLPTSSSKQNRQFKMIASAVRAENMFMAKIKANNDAINAQKKAEQKQEAQKAIITKDQPSFDSIQPLKPENLLIVKSKEGMLSELISKTSSSIGWPKLQTTRALANKRCSLPPVEISITDSAANLTI